LAISIRTGNAVALLRAMPADSVHCCVTSPPYWGLRDYGTPPQIWGGDPDCRHRWGGEISARAKTAQVDYEKSGLKRDGRPEAQRLRTLGNSNPRGTKTPSNGAFCRHCGAWRGSLGLEPTYQLYVDHLVEVLREVRRVLRPDGTLWLNLGDCYATGGGKAKRAGGRGQGDRWEKYGPSGYQGVGEVGYQPNRMPQPGLKPKDLVGIPWRVAFALQDGGWWLRRDNVWSKPNPMPESVRDRCTSSHEYLFHLTKSARYYFDHEAIKEPFADERNGNPGCYSKTSARSKGATRERQDGGFLNAGGGWNADGSVTGRNKRSVWTITTSPFPEAHFATFPPALIQPCILAGTSERGVCPHCGAPWQRMVKKGAVTGRHDVGGTDGYRDCGIVRAGEREVTTVGWRASCSCRAGAPIPATVLDPFLGSGTTAMVADRLGRDCIGLELRPAYAAMARRRTRAPEPRLQRAA
jgi:DNA modification methylase